MIGRHEERHDLAAFVADQESPANVRFIEGPPGAGKTALFNYAIDEAKRSGVRVYRSSVAEAEAALPYAVLGDLFANLPVSLIESLPSMQRGAMESALMRGAADGTDNAPHAVARGLLGVVRALAAADPFVLAVDDVQWMDGPTERALLFVLRRLEDTRVRIVLTRRLREAEHWPEVVQRAFAEASRRHWRLGPLTVDEVAQLLGSKLGLNLPRPALVVLHRRSEGNPLFALELGRALRAGHDLTSDELDPDDVGSLLRARLDALSVAAGRSVLAASAAAQPTSDLLAKISGEAATDEAVTAEILRRDGERIRFVHPLFASVAYARASEDERSRVHSTLADLVGDDEESALHRARGTRAPSEEISNTLERAAARAASRGAPEVGAELAEHAARLTPTSQESERRRRQVLAADHLLASGDPQRARSMLEQLVADLDPGTERADVLWRLADAVGDDLALSTRLAEQALLEAGDDDELKTTIRVALATFTWLSGDLAQSAVHVREAARLAERSGSDQSLGVALGEVFHAEAVLGQESDPELVARALEIEKAVNSFPMGARPSFQLGIVYSYTDRLDEARPLLEAELKRVEASGDESARVAALFRLAELDLRAGNWASALRRASDSSSLAAQAGIEQEQCVALTALGAVLAHLGRSDEAVAAAQRAFAMATANGDRMSLIRLRGVLGFTALSAGDPEGAIEWLAPAMAEIEAMDIGELSIYNVVQNHFEALTMAGNLDEADRVVDLVERKGALQGRAWHSCMAARGRALIAAARGQEDEALRWSEAALAAHALLPQPFEYARALLVRGSIQRRYRQRGAARRTLVDALERFDALGAGLWAERAAAELGRIGGRAPAGDSLTETQEQIASLVADGLSNTEVAARMFVTVRTVEAHLSRIYSKLGIRSRVDIVRWLGGRPNKG